jgi:hypothetical protein
MMEYLRDRADDRTLILFALGCWAGADCFDKRDWVEAWNEVTDAVLAGTQPLGRLICLFGAFNFVTPPTPERWVEMVTERPDPSPARHVQAAIVRDIFGNPFRPVAFDPRWRTADVLGLAHGIYDGRAFDRMPLLADALMDAGCADEQVIGHCRSEGPHVRGCWVVDLILSKDR